MSETLLSGQSAGCGMKNEPIDGCHCACCGFAVRAMGRGRLPTRLKFWDVGEPPQ